MSPLPSGLGRAGQFVADGARIAFTQLGRPPSGLKRDAPLPAKLTLAGRFMERVREPGGEESRDLASLNGTILLEAGATNFVFTGVLDADGAPLGLEPTEVVGDEDDATEDDPREVRLLRFTFDSAQFQQVGEARDASELALRIDAARFDYCEISVKLEIGGQVEASATANDTLDVLITDKNPRRRELVTVRFTDEQGQVIPGAAVRILSGAKPLDSAADPTALTADGNGELRLRNVPGADKCEVAWGPSADNLKFRRQLFLELGEDAGDADERRLQNLGYPAQRGLADNVLSFQADFGRPASGRVGDISGDLVAFHDDGARPTLGDAVDPSSEAVAVNGPTNRDFDDLADAPSGAEGVAVA